MKRGEEKKQQPTLNSRIYWKKKWANPTIYYIYLFSRSSWNEEKKTKISNINFTKL